MITLASFAPYQHVVPLSQEQKCELRDVIQSPLPAPPCCAPAKQKCKFFCIDRKYPSYVIKTIGAPRQGSYLKPCPGFMPPLAGSGRVSGGIFLALGLHK